MVGGTRNLLFAFVCIALGGLLFGFIIGVNSSVISPGQLLCKDGSLVPGTWTSWGIGQCYALPEGQLGLLSAVNIIGALIASLICFRYADDMGRKMEVQVASGLYLAGITAASLSPVLWGIYAGLLMYGLGIGFAMHAAPVYIAEIAPANKRGALIAAKEACVVMGMCLGFLYGFVLVDIEATGWRWMIAGSAPFAVLMGLGMFFVPESPRFLIQRSLQGAGSFQDSQSDAARALQFFRQAEHVDEVAAELAALTEELSKSLNSDSHAGWTEPFRYPRHLLIGCGLVFLQQVTGQPSVLYFASNVFRSAGLGAAAELSSLGVGLVKLLATLVATGCVDVYGRRLLLFVGIGMMTAALALVATAFAHRTCNVQVASLGECADADILVPTAWAWATVCGLMVYVSGYQVGFGPISWLMISEVFPMRIRGSALSVAAIVNFGSNIGMTIAQPVLLSAISPVGTFLIYMVLCLVSLGFVYQVVPETKGKTLEEIEVMLGAHKAD